MNTEYTGYLGPFDHEHKNPPAPFNPLYKAHAAQVWDRAVSEVWARGGFAELPQIERAAQLRVRYDELMQEWENDNA